MISKGQMTFDLKTEEGRQQFEELIMRTCSPEFQRYLGLPVMEEETETDDNESEVQRRREQDRQHRDHVRRVKELERDNRRRNPER